MLVSETFPEAANSSTCNETGVIWLPGCEVGCSLEGCVKMEKWTRGLRISKWHKYVKWAMAQTFDRTLSPLLRSMISLVDNSSWIILLRRNRGLWVFPDNTLLPLNIDTSIILKAELCFSQVTAHQGSPKAEHFLQPKAQSKLDAVELLERFKV